MSWVADDQTATGTQGWHRLGRDWLGGLGGPAQRGAQGHCFGDHERGPLGHW